MKRILVIDDSPETLTFLSDLLSRNGYEVIQARDGVEGKEKLQAEKPDLVCLDILLPQESGVKLYHEMRRDEQTKTVPVVVIDDIASSSEGVGKYLDFHRFIEKQASVSQPEGYVKEPLNGDEFLREVNKALAR